MNGRLLQGVIIIPSALTLGNLFFGLWAMIAAARGDFEGAAWLIVAAAILDLLDGRVARFTQTGTRFGGELDSLVDVISFGVAPGLIIYHLFLTEGVWGWVPIWIYVTAAAVRLARFNIEQAGHAKVAFHGLPSPTAGMALATFYPFSQTAFFQQYLADWRWPTIMTALMVVLAVLMMSHILYPVLPKFGFRTLRGILTGAFLLILTVLAITVPAYYFFPATTAYIAYGILKTLALGFFERLPARDPLLDEVGDEADAELRRIDYAEMESTRLRGRVPGLRGRRRRPPPTPEPPHEEE